MTIRNEEENEEEIVVQGERPFPDVYYCPITQGIMKDPVVDPSGDSYERSAITARDDTVTYYPNRALKSIINKSVAQKEDEGSLRGKLRSWDESIRSGWQQMLEKSAIPSRDYRPLPESFYCPITCELIHQPVIDKDGNTFEKIAIENWIRVNGNSPITRNTASIDDLRPNNALQDLIEEEKERSDESIHPSIRRWKESVPPLVTPSAPVEVPPGTGGRPTATPAGLLPPTAVPPPPTAGQPSYPTTPAELEARQRRMNQRQTIGVVAFVLIILLLVFAVPYAGWVIFFLVLTVICFTSKGVADRRST